MPEPTLDQIAPGGVIQLQGSPAGLDDATFDSLFPAEPSQATHLQLGLIRSQASLLV